MSNARFLSRRHCLLFCLFSVSAFPLWAQDRIEVIVERNLFDPFPFEEVEEEAPPEEVIPVETAPVELFLDGTMIFKDKRYAIIRYMADPEPAATPEKTRLADPRSKRKPARRGPQMKTKMMSLNGELKGYTLTKVDINSATLMRGPEQVRLEMFNGTKQNRGGSKKLSAKPAPKKAGKKVAKTPNVRDKNRNDKSNRSERAKNRKDPKKSQGLKRGNVDVKNRSNKPTRRKPPIEF
ncbi:hypothetical protein SCOR_12060 [Sulfidibacter corallicola]|uniref:Uncharacterized protein n=1 Tax=Sulfidibacter corallicola TaxID=2818388 RepID=A0A8A4TMW6_SULCO|nr:hypothetical protein [Sulfidibacter corallicola]QTD47935.1 hypothetical protein J3U87_20305 [Sulfidibacter corallicola]